MKALILAAGKGSRLKEKTGDIPKCLVKVNEKPILEYQLEALKANNVKDIAIVVGYKKERIRDFLKNPKFAVLNIKLIENKEYETTNSSYSGWLARKEIMNEDYIHLNCDVLFFPELIKRLIECKYKNVIVIDKKVRLIEFKMEHVELKGDKIIKMDNHGCENAVGKGSGIAKFSPENTKYIMNKIDEYVKKGDKNENYYGIIREAINHLNFYGLDSNGCFLTEINTLEELENAEKMLKNRKK